MLAKIPLGQVPYPGNHLSFLGEPYLTTLMFDSMMMFRSVDGCHNWTDGPAQDPKILIIPNNHGILAIKCPTNLKRFANIPHPLSIFLIQRWRQCLWWSWSWWWWWRKGGTTKSSKGWNRLILWCRIPTMSSAIYGPIPSNQHPLWHKGSKVPSLWDSIFKLWSVS